MTILKFPTPTNNDKLKAEYIRITDEYDAKIDLLLEELEQKTQHIPEELKDEIMTDLLKELLGSE